MNVQFHTVARKELISILDYYRKIQTDLPGSFLENLEYTIYHIKKFPDSGTVFHQNIQKKKLNRYPYSVYYTYRKGKELKIIAIKHHRRNSEYVKKII